MKRINSLKGIRIFRVVYSKGKRFRAKGYKLFVLKMELESEIFTDCRIGNYKAIKIGISINRNFGRANIRNRAKRRIRSIVDGLLHEMNEGFCMIIIPDENFRTIDYNDNEKNFRQLLFKAGVI